MRFSKATIPILLAIVLIAPFTHMVRADGESWLDGWLYRKSHTINGTTAGAQTDYQIRIIIHYGAGADSGVNVYLDSKCRTDFGDIRFTNSSGADSESLDYLIEKKVDSDNAIVWVKVDNIPISPGNSTIYIYYGNDDATTTSNGPNTFIAYQDYDEQADGDPPTGWNKVGVNSFEIADDQYYSPLLSMFASGASTGGYRPLILTVNRALEFWIRRNEDDKTTDLRVNENAWVDGDIGPYIVFRDIGTIEYYDVAYHFLVAYNPGQWYRMTIKDIDFGADTYDIDVDGINYADDVNFFLNHDFAILELFGELVSAGGGTVWIDSILLRKYCDPEPVSVAWGSEESGPAPPVAVSVVPYIAIGIILALSMSLLSEKARR